jgi:hypothetical protein
VERGTIHCHLAPLQVRSICYVVQGYVHVHVLLLHMYTDMYIDMYMYMLYVIMVDMSCYLYQTGDIAIRIAVFIRGLVKVFRCLVCGPCVSRSASHRDQVTDLRSGRRRVAPGLPDREGPADDCDNPTMQSHAGANPPIRPISTTGSSWAPTHVSHWTRYTQQTKGLSPKQYIRNRLNKCSALRYARRREGGIHRTPGLVNFVVPANAG